MKILLAGATGQIGYALAHALSRAGHDVTVLVRDANIRFNHTIKVVAEPEFNQAVFARELRGMDCAYYGIGLPEQFTFDAGIFERVNLGMLKMFLHAMESSGVHKLVYLSTYHVFSTLNGVIRESHPLAPPDHPSAYFRAMIKAYAEATSFAARSGARLATIHPAALYGGRNTGDGFTNVLENLLNWRLWNLPVVLPGRFPLVHADSLADAIVRALGHGGAFLVSDGMCDLKQLARTLRAQANSYNPPVAPAALAYAATAPVEALARALRFRPMLCKAQLDFITDGAEPLADKAKQTLGWTPMSIDQGVQRYLNDRSRLLAMG